MRSSLGRKYLKRNNSRRISTFSRKENFRNFVGGTGPTFFGDKRPVREQSRITRYFREPRIDISEFSIDYCPIRSKSLVITDYEAIRVLRYFDEAMSIWEQRSKMYRRSPREISICTKAHRAVSKNRWRHAIVVKIRAPKKARFARFSV